MDDIRIGRILRALRLRLGLRQVDVARAAGVSQSLISLIERGHLASVSIATLRRVFAALDARFEGSVSWRGGALDRLLDEAHADLVERVARYLRSRGWLVHIEVTFNEFGDRGSIDVLGLRPDLGIAVLIEIKTEIAAADDTARRFDVKTRLLPRIVYDRFGWRPAVIGRLLVVRDTMTNRRRVASLQASLDGLVPDRGPVVRRWLREPRGPMAGLLFFSGTNRRGVRTPRSSAGGAPPRDRAQAPHPFIGETPRPSTGHSHHVGC
jgi:transcriptional regulator with XRE-family HTH domain